MVVMFCITGDGIRQVKNGVTVGKAIKTQEEQPLSYQRIRKFLPSRYETLRPIKWLFSSQQRVDDELSTSGKQGPSASR